MSRRRFALAFLSLALLWSVPATPAFAQVVDPAFRADVEKLMTMTGAAGVGTQMANFVSGQMLDAMRKTQPDVPEQAVSAVKEVLAAEFAKAFTAPDGLSPKLVAAYARHFTHEDVVGLLRFYDTELGRKLIAVTPSLVQESALAGQEWMQANGPRIAAAVQSRLRAEGFIK